MGSGLGYLLVVEKQELRMIGASCMPNTRGKTTAGHRGGDDEQNQENGQVCGREWESGP